MGITFWCRAIASMVKNTAGMLLSEKVSQIERICFYLPSAKGSISFGQVPAMEHLQLMKLVNQKNQIEEY